MKRVIIAVLAASGLLVGVLSYAEHSRFESSRSILLGQLDSHNVALKPAPIQPSWILEGRPEASASEMYRTSDGTMRVLVWQTSKGRFRWRYDEEEILQIVDGEAFVTDSDGTTHRFGPGDIVTFPAHARAEWRVPDHVRKIAYIKHPLPSVVESAMRWLRYLRHQGEPEPAFGAG